LEGGREVSAAAAAESSQLTSQLIHVLDELETKDKMVKQLEAEVQRYSRDFSKVSMFAVSEELRCL
jgi:hypothetical protein